MKKQHDSANGFSLVELLVGTVLFTIISGAVFSLLMSAQLRYRGESNVTETFQQANVALDQITRDVHSAGYPPRSSVTANVATFNPDKYALPFAWSPDYPGRPCTMGGSCTVPGNYDLILEADVNETGVVQWIRYSLVGTTLMRGVAQKQPFTDPVGATAGSAVLVSYLENVTNGNTGVPIFTYGYDAGALQQPSNIREVNICLMVQAPQPDPQTGQYRTITLTGQAVRFNPNQ